MMRKKLIKIERQMKIMGFCLTLGLGIFTNGTCVNAQQKLSAGENTHTEEKQQIAVASDVIESYVEVLNDNDYETGLQVFGLVYINDDDIPELFISISEAHYVGVDLYTYYNGECVQIGTVGSFGTCQVSPKNNIIMGTFTGNGSTTYDFYSIYEDSLEHLSGFGETNLVSGTEISYYVDSNAVDEEEYQAALSAVYDADSFIEIGEEAPNRFELTSDNIEAFSLETYKFILE